MTDYDFEFEALSGAVRYRQAISREFHDALQGTVLEIGAGIGQMTEEFLKLPQVKRIVAVEPDPRYATTFRTRLPSVPIHEGTVRTLEQNAAFDAAVMINVLEHIDDDTGCLIDIRKHLLPRKGQLCILVPARPEIYSRIDAQFGHVRRYTRKTLSTTLLESGYRISQMHYFNLAGYFAWYASFTLLGRTHFDPRHVNFFDRFIFRPTNSLERRLLRPPIGQSLVAIAHSTE